MPSLSFKNNHLLTITAALLLIPGSYYLFSDGLSLEATRSTKALWDLGHVVYFALLTFIFLKLPYLTQLSFFKRSVIVIILAIIIGIVIEALQYGTARHTDIVDVAHDVLGSLIVLALYQPLKARQHNDARIMFHRAVTLLCIISLWPLVSAIGDELHAKVQFPVLADFSSPLELNRWSGSAEMSYVTNIEQASGAMRIDFKTDRFSGISLNYFEHNWAQYDFLNLVIYSEQKLPVLRTLKVYDLKHKMTDYLWNDRYNHRLTIKTGWNTFKIPITDIEYAPKTRTMNLKYIANLSIFSTHLSQPQTIYLKSIYLSQ